VVSGKVSESKASQFRALLKHLQIITDDMDITLDDIDSGSIKFSLSCAEDSARKIKEAMIKGILEGFFDAEILSCRIVTEPTGASIAKKALELVGGSFFRAAPGGEILSASGSFLDLLESRIQEDLTGKLVLPPEILTCLQDAYGETLKNKPIIWPMADNSTKHLSLSAEWVESEAGSSVEGVLVAAPEENKSAFKMHVNQDAEVHDRMRRLASSLAHDFNNLLTAIIGYSQILLQQSESNPSMASPLHAILKAGVNMAELIRKLGTYGGALNNSPKPFEVGRYFETLKESLTEHDPKMVFRVKCPEDIGSISVDPNHFETVVRNIVQNAVEASPFGGIISVSAQKVEVKGGGLRIRNEEIRQGVYVKVSVQDSGKGIEDDDFLEIFHPYSTTKENHRGFGLAEVLGLVKLNGGYVSIGKTLSQGTIVSTYWPCIANESVSTDRLGFQTNLKVLLALDQAADRQALTDVLESNNYSVVVLSNFDEASQLLKNTDLLITEYENTYLAGVSFAEAVVAAKPETRVLILCEAKSSPLVFEEVSARGFYYLKKPFGPSNFIRKIKELFEIETGQEKLS